jgi:predicted dehydrogenase
MTDIEIGYVGVDHLHRDPYFQLFDVVGADVTCVCEPNEAFDFDALEAMSDRPDDLPIEGLDVGATVAEAAVYRDPLELLEEEDVDLLWLSLPNRDTPPVIEAAVEHGVHVMSEKPMARTAEELEPAAELARERGVTVGVSYFNRGHPTVRELRSLAAEGFFGDVRTVDARFLASKLEFRDTTSFVYDGEASRGGALQWLGVHWIDHLMWVLDDPITRVNAQAVSTTDGVDVEDGMTLQFETGTGATGTFQTGYYLGGTRKDTALDIYGSRGRARTSAWRGDPVTLDLHSYAEGSMGAPERTIDYHLSSDRFPAWGDLALSFFQGFFDSLTGDADPPADVDDALRVLRVLDAAYESAGTEAWVETGL